MLQFLLQAEKNKDNIAVKEGDKIYTYENLLDESLRLAMALLNGAKDLSETRVAFMVNPGFDYIKVQWAIWQAGGICVPIYTSAPLASIEYTIENTQADIVIVSSDYKVLLNPLCRDKSLRLVVLGNTPMVEGTLPEISDERRAMILFTSGTTSLPKGVVTTHQNIQAQITCLIKAWEWRASDHILCVLPLHHVHGIINVIGCAMWAGACCEFMPVFSPQNMFEIVKQRQVNLFMAVPTIYHKLISFWEQLPKAEQQEITTSFSSFRLMVSGSAALPVSVMEKWLAISNNTLLERYGMTEIGMALSNPYAGKRKPGYVGTPLPDVSVRLSDEKDLPVSNGSGEIQIKGSTVFLEYWNNEKETKKAFTADGWFKTGDIAEIDDEGYYKILGRNSQDIIKSGGYKISAIEIEEVIRQHLSISDCSVIGLPDEEWGETVAAVLVAKQPVELKLLNDWLRERLSKYKIPRAYKLVSELPRNAMGKVVKNELKKLFSNESIIK